MASKPKKCRKESMEEDYDDLILTVKLEGTELKSNDIYPTDSTTDFTSYVSAPVKLEPIEMITESSDVVSSNIGLTTLAPIKLEHETIDIEETDIKPSRFTPSDISPAASVPFESSVGTTIPSRLLFLEVAPLTISSSDKAGPSNQTNDKTLRVHPKQSTRIKVPSKPGVESKSADEINILDDLISDERDSDIDYDYSSDDMDFADEESQRDEDIRNDKLLWNENSSCMNSNFVFDRQELFKHLQDKPIQIFKKIINEGFLYLVAKATNNNGRKDKDWNHLSTDELLTFFALVLHTGTFGLTNLSDYWKVHYLYSLPSFSKYMSRHRFMQIMKYLSCYRRDTTNCDPLHKVHELLYHFTSVMNYFYDPGANLVVPQPLIYNGRLLPKQQIRDKCSRIQVHSLGSSTGIVFRLKVTNKAYNRSSLVQSLLEENLDCGHCVYVSEYYNTITLASRLLSRRTYCTGPLDPLGSSVNSLVKSQKLPGPQSVPEFHSFYQSGLHIIKTRKSFFLSTQHDEERLHMQTSHAGYSSKPKPVAMYDSVMYNDFCKEYDSYYPCRMNSLKWQKKMIIHVLYQGLVNAYHLHNLKNPNSFYTGFYYFRLNILEKLLPNYVPMGKKHALTKSSKTKESIRRGVLVKTKELRKYICENCKVKKNIKTITLYFCSECEGSPGYCIKCFYEVHSNTVLGPEQEYS